MQNTKYEIVKLIKKNMQINIEKIDEEIDLLIEATSEILRKAIEKGGTTIRSYTSSLGVTGRFQNELGIHTKEVCPICGNKVMKIKVGGRGTYFCPSCQK